MKLIHDLGTLTYGNQSKVTRYGIYECPDCKTHFKTSTSDVKRKKTNKCSKCSKKTHGFSNSFLYPIWKNIISRTTNINCNNFNNYGGRGITICCEWKNDFKSFYDWCMDNGYKKGLSIDRIDNDGNYEPSNCRFVAKYIQARNTRVLIKTNKSGFRGVSYYKETKKWKAQIRVNNKKIALGYFKTAEDAGYAYDKYVIDNNLEHNTNGLYKKEPE